MGCMNASESRTLTIDTLRGLAILGVVWHHVRLWVFNDLESTNIEMDTYTALFYRIDSFIAPFRMPLFTLLSGWVYAIRPFSKDNLERFIGGKFRRIVLPLFFGSTLFYFLELFANGTYPTIGNTNGIPVQPGGFWMLWFFGFGHLWFLQALLFLFATICVIDYFKLAEKPLQFIGICLLLTVAIYNFPPSELFSLRKIESIAPHFYVGVFLQRFSHLFTSRKAKTAIWAAFLTVMLVHFYWVLAGRFFPRDVHYVLLGSLFPMAVLTTRLRIPSLAYIGQFSYSIFLYHNLARFIVSYPLDSPYGQLINIVALFGIGLACPIIIEWVVTKIPVARTPILGKSVFVR